MMDPEAPPDVEPISVQIAYQVAAHEGRDPCDLPPLYSEIDPEALDSLCEHLRAADSDNRISFEYLGYTIRIAIEDDEVLTSVEPSAEEAIPS